MKAGRRQLAKNERPCGANLGDGTRVVRLLSILAKSSILSFCCLICRVCEPSQVKAQHKTPTSSFFVPIREDVCLKKIAASSKAAILVRLVGVEPTRPGGTWPSTMPVCQFQHKRILRQGVL